MTHHPVDYYNFYGNFADIFKGVKNHNMITPNEVALFHPTEPNPNDLNMTTFKLNPKSNQVLVVKANGYGFAVNAIISKFMLLCAVCYKNNTNAATSYITFELMGIDIPYIRVRCDYFKVINKDDRYGGVQINLVAWKKDEITQDHSKSLFNNIQKFDDFTIFPDNKNHSAIIKNCYNLYSKFPHVPHSGVVSEKDIPVTWNFINHIFGDSDGRKNQVNEALIYFKILYENPKQQLPILSVISKPRKTGKTTLLNFFDMIFGNNFIQVSPEELTDTFNASFATKNIIAADETFLEKSHAVEKIKSLATQKMINLSDKFISKYPIPFFGKVILFSNKVRDFMKIEVDEVRFWVRRVPLISGKKNTKIEEQLFNEIPKFLKYIEQLPDINYDNGERAVLTDEQIMTDDLFSVKMESKSQLYKEIEILLQDYFYENQSVPEIMITPTDIKEHERFRNNNQVSISYIRKVLRDEVDVLPQKLQRYTPFNNFEKYPLGRVGTPYLFKNPTPISVSVNIATNEPPY